MYRQVGEYRKSFASWCSAVSLQPLRIFGNIRILFKIFFPAFPIENLKVHVQNILPERLYWRIVPMYKKLARKFL